MPPSAPNSSRHPNTTDQRTSAAGGSHGGGSRLGFGLVAYALGVALVGSNLPTPLYRLYQRLDHFSTSVLTLIFVVYVVAVAVALVLAGQLSDRFGRPAVLLPGVLLAALSAVSFAISPAIPWLVTGRLTGGLAAGALTSVAPGALVELEPRGDAARASVVASAVTVSGLALGPMLSALVVQYGPWPTRLIYLLQLFALAPALVGMTALARRAHGASSRGDARLRRPAVAPAVRSVFARTALAFSAGWVGTAMFFALGPMFARAVLHTRGQIAGATLVFVVFVASGAAQMLSRRTRRRTATVGGLLLFSAGMLALPVSLALAAPTMLVGGAVAAGAGQGLTHRATQEEVVAASPPQARGETIAAFYLAGYAPVAVLLVALGAAIDATSATIGLGAFVAVVVTAALTAAVLTLRANRSTAA